MRHWRPAHKCIYIIPEIYGSINELKIIISRIFPLRFSKGQEDMIIFLGNYIGKGSSSSDVLEFLFELNNLKSNIFFLKGASEQALLDALISENNYLNWLRDDGFSIIRSYTGKNNYIPFNRLLDIIPNHHISFINNNLLSYLNFEKYLFINNKNNLPLNKDNDKIYISSINNNKLPIFNKNNFILGGLAPKKLMVFELNSKSCDLIKNGKSRIYKYNFILNE